MEGCLSSSSNSSAAPGLGVLKGAGIELQTKHAARPTSSANNVLGGYTPELQSVYDFAKTLGAGQAPNIRLVTNKTTGEVLACRSIPKSKLVTPEDIADVQREVQIMHHLAGHPNVVTLRGTYEDLQHVHLVMEVCQGGELFDRIVERGCFTEKDAVKAIRAIVKVVQYCHNMNVIHRDLRPENFLLTDNTESATIKATGFGLSVFFRFNQAFEDIVGSASYIAPEVLRRNYGKEADIWSCGVMLYILLSGMPPFYGDNEEQIIDAVLHSEPDFETDPWPRLSGLAKDCVKRMLVRDPSNRATAAEVLAHEWIRGNGVAGDGHIEPVMLKRVCGSAGKTAGVLNAEAPKVIAGVLPMDEVTGLKDVFSSLDQAGGTITIDEVLNALRAKGNIPESELQRIKETGGNSSQLQFTAADGTTQALVSLLNSSNASVQEKAAAALCNLQQPVDLRDVQECHLATLRACSGLTFNGFRRWLAARTSGVVLLSGKWLFEQVPAEQQQSYFRTLAEQGYLQVAEGADHLLPISPHGLQQLQQRLQEELLDAMQGSSCSDSEITSSPACEGGDVRQRRDQGKQSAVSWALRNSIGLVFPRAAGAGQQEQDAGSTAQGTADTMTESNSALPPLPVDTCVRLALPTSDWWDRGFDDSLRSESNASSVSANNSAVLAVIFRREQQDCKLTADVRMQACMKHEGNNTLLGFKLEHILASVQHGACGDSSSSSSSSTSGGSSSRRFSKQKGVVLGFLDRVCLSLEVQRQDGSEPLPTINYNDPDYVVEKRPIQNDHHYKYKEHLFKGSLELGLVPKATLGWDTAFKQSPGSAGVVEVPLVTVKTQSQGQVPAAFGFGSSPCTVEVMRQPRNTLLCNATSSLGTINSNPGNKHGEALCYQVLVPPDCLSSSGHLLPDKLIVKVAVCAVGGLLNANTTGKVLHNAQEVEVHGTFATSMIDGRVVKLSPLLPLEETPWPGCKLHPHAAA